MSTETLGRFYVKFLLLCICWSAHPDHLVTRIIRSSWWVDIITTPHCRNAVQLYITQCTIILSTNTLRIVGELLILRGG